MEAYREDRELKNREGYPFEIQIQSHCGKGMLAHPHFHDFIEILYCLQGGFHVQLGGSHYRLAEGDMALIHCQEVHRTFALGEGANRYVVIKLLPELLFSTEQTPLEMQYLLAITSGIRTHRRIFDSQALQETIVPGLIRELVKERKNREYGFEMAIRIRLCELFLWILRGWHTQGIEIEAIAGINVEAMRQVQQVFEFVEEHYGDKLKMEEVAELLNMSYSSFSKFFVRHTGVNFTDYLTNQRITKSKILLATTDRSVTEIAFEVGFSTTSYFIQCFKSRIKATPQQFRKQFL